MYRPDLNLLIALDVLLEEESVAGAARRLNLSAPAMSRTLGRIRDALGDPVLVRAGRKLVPTQRALEIRDRLHAVTAEAVALLQPVSEQGLGALEREFTLRTDDVFVAAFGGELLKRLRETAPGIRLRSVPRGASEEEGLREGAVDLMIGATDPLSPEVRVQTLFSTRMVGLARSTHPLFEGEISPKRFAAFDHIVVSRRGERTSPIDIALEAFGLSRTVVLVGSSFTTGIFSLPNSDYLLAVPEHFTWGVERLGANIRVFDIPLELPGLVVRQAWHPRFENDAVHRWLRQTVFDVCRTSRPGAADEIG